ncbi:hypothetical protein [Prosthecobacter sp.]|uniref:hypothetical protein n=1 Tax=Prosthecobacter sp. TaxID=1965333 RepID=UPI002488E4D4|nr:hypothetical protein [Prosthecobacter sp.]MDI1313680.1 hypothetical protein [Prosthecobacter sp.]
MHSRSLLCVTLFLQLLLPACNIKYGPMTRGYGYPLGLSVLAPRLGSAGNYTYYPRYEAYYRHDSQQFYYPNGKNWEVKPTVLNNSAQEIRATPGVPFQLHDHPSKYHGQIKQAFPVTWTPGQGRADEPYEFGRSGWDLDNR